MVRTAGEMDKSTLTVVLVIDKVITQKMNKDLGELHKSQHWLSGPTWNPAFSAKDGQDPRAPTNVSGVITRPHSVLYKSHRIVYIQPLFSDHILLS